MKQNIPKNIPAYSQKSWLWPLVIALATVGWQVFSALSIWVVDLIIPIAALLGSRYGKHGIVMVALGGLPLLLSWQYGSLFGGSCMDIYIVSLVVSAMAASKWPGNSQLSIHSRRAYVLLFLLLPLSVGLYSSEGSGFQYDLIITFDVVVYLAVFLLGVSGYSTRLVVVTLAGFTIAGMLLEWLQLPGNAQELLGGTHAELPVFGYTQLRNLWIGYGLDNPATCFTAVGWFVAGKTVASMFETHEPPTLPWHRSYLPVVLLALVGLGWETNTYVAELITESDSAPTFMLLGSFYALPCAALLGGLLLRMRGVLLVLVMLLVFVLLDALIRANFEFLLPQFSFVVREPAAVMGFGALGIALRNRLLGTRDVWWSWQWASYIVITIVVIPIFFSLDSFFGFLWMVLSMIGSIVLGQWLAALRKRYLGWLPSHGGWLALLGVVVSIVLIVRSRETITQMVATIYEWSATTITSVQAGEGWDTPDGDETIAVIFLAAGCALFLAVLRRFLRDAPACVRDIRALFSALREKPLVAEAVDVVAPVAIPDKSMWTRTREVFTTVVGAARNVAAIILIAIILIQGVMMVYPSDGIIATTREWFSPNEDIAAYDVNVSEPANTNNTVNPWLWQSVRETFTNIPAEVNEREGVLTTEWYNPINESGRQQVDIQVGDALESYALRVELRRQQRGLFGLWIEQGSYWDPRKGEFVGVDVYPQQQEIADSLLARAKDLEQAAAR